MAYKVDKFNGTFLTNVQDGTIDTTTDLRFVGKNYAGYGEVQNENFLHLMENFSNTTQPPKAVVGQIWYDSANKKLRFYDGSKFKFANGAETADTAPTGLAVGEFWWDTSAKQLYTWSGTDYILVGPEAAPDLGASAVQAQSVKDNISPVPNSHAIVKIISGGKVMAVVSRDAFTLNSSINPIDGFTAIKKGITLVDANALGETSNDNYFWGTASDSNRLGQRPASDYLLKTDLTYTSEVNFQDPGFTLGNDNDLRIRIENSDELIFENQLGNPFVFRVTVAQTTDERDVAVIGIDTVSSDGVLRPGLDNTYKLGTSLLRWKNAYAVDFYGNLTGNVTGNTTGVHKGNVQASDSSVMVNAATKQFFGQLGTPTVEALMYGSLIGNCQGTATTANNLREFAPSIGLVYQNDGITLVDDQRAVPIRSVDGDITARRFIGIADKADQLLVGASYRSSSLAATANTIAARDGSGDIFARLFQGTATSAQYADLAEKYLADQEYEVGTVVVVGGEAEVTASSSGKRALGVVSANPAFMMNKDLEGGTYIALKGRVPVKVYGRVKKGDELIAGNEGNAIAGEGKVFAIALESNDNPSVKLVEAVVL